MHSRISGVTDHLAENDEEALEICRAIVENLNTPVWAPPENVEEPLYPAEELYGIVHRDLKPGNVWLAEDGLAKIDPDDLAAMDSAIPHPVGRGAGRRGCPQPPRPLRP